MCRDPTLSASPDRTHRRLLESASRYYSAYLYPRRRRVSRSGDDIAARQPMPGLVVHDVGIGDRRNRSRERHRQSLLTACASVTIDRVDPEIELRGRDGLFGIIGDRCQSNEERAVRRNDNLVEPRQKRTVARPMRQINGDSRWTITKDFCAGISKRILNCNSDVPSP